MTSKIRFRDYCGYCEYAEAPARKLELALPKEILDNPFVKYEIERLKLTTWQYSVDGSTREGTFYWNDGEKAWKYYEREEMIDVLDENDETDALEILEAYLNNPDNWDDGFPKFSDEEDED